MDNQQLASRGALTDRLTQQFQCNVFILQPLTTLHVSTLRGPSSGYISSVVSQGTGVIWFVIPVVSL